MHEVQTGKTRNYAATLRFNLWILYLFQTPSASVVCSLTLMIGISQFYCSSYLHCFTESRAHCFCMNQSVLKAKTLDISTSLLMLFSSPGFLTQTRSSATATTYEKSSKESLGTGLEIVWRVKSG